MSICNNKVPLINWCSGAVQMKSYAPVSQQGTSQPKRSIFFLAFQRRLCAPCLWKCYSISSFPQISHEKLRLDEEQSKSCVCPAWRRASFLVFLLERVWIPLFYFAWMLLGADNPTFLPSHCWIDHVVLIEAINNGAVPGRVAKCSCTPAVSHYRGVSD